MKVNKKVMIFAVLIGIIVVGITYSYINTLKSQKVNPVKYIEVVVAIDNIPNKTEITAEMLDYQSIPESFVHEDAILDSSDIIGGITTAEIIKKEQVLRSRVLTDSTQSSLSYRVKENMRAMTIPISEITGVAGYAEPGDNIDILVCYQTVSDTDTVSMVYTQLQNIPILEEGIDTEANTEQTVTSISSFTVMVTPEQAEVLAYAIMNGSIQCALRNPIDNVKAELQMFGDDNFNTWRDR